MNVELSRREVAVIRFALFRLAEDARHHAVAAAQDIKGRFYRDDAVDKFFKDADDADALRKKLEK